MIDSNETKNSVDEERVTSMLSKHKKVLDQVWQAMRLKLCENGMETDMSLVPRPELASYFLVRDPYDQSETLSGEWRDKYGELQGEIKIRGDGRIYAEVNIIRNHPKDARWFVEAVSAWGRSDDLKTELKLLASI